jgi:hypothetical protein
MPEEALSAGSEPTPAWLLLRASLRASAELRSRRLLGTPRSTDARQRRDRCIAQRKQACPDAPPTRSQVELRQSSPAPGSLSHPRRSRRRTSRRTKLADRLSASVRPWSFPWSLSERISHHLRAPQSRSHVLDDLKARRVPPSSPGSPIRNRSIWRPRSRLAIVNGRAQEACSPVSRRPSRPQPFLRWSGSS